MARSQNPLDHWAGIIEFYRQLVDEYEWDQQPMLNLATALSKSNYAGTIFPSTSHEALGLSTVEQYEARRALPMVYVQYVSKKAVFEIHYQKGQGNTVRIAECRDPLEPESFSEITSWLKPKPKVAT